MPQESDVIKINCFKEIEKERLRLEVEKKESKVHEPPGEEIKPDPKIEPKAKVKEVETISVTNLFTRTKTIENEEDIDLLLNEIKQSLKKILDQDKVDWVEQVEIIGWMYQYYISEKKDEVIQAKKKYKKEEIPFATQLFTPDWIVRYMVQNSLKFFITVLSMIFSPTCNARSIP